MTFSYDGLGRLTAANFRMGSSLGNTPVVSVWGATYPYADFNY